MEGGEDEGIRTGQSDRNPGRKAGTGNGGVNDEKVKILCTSQEKWNGKSIY